MPKTVVIKVPKFIQKIALQFGLILDSVSSTEYKFFGEMMTFIYFAKDRDFKFSFEFEVSYYSKDDTDNEVFKISELENMKYIRLETVKHGSQVLEFDDIQLKGFSIGGLNLLIDEFMQLKKKY